MDTAYFDPGIAWLPVLGGVAVFLDLLFGDPRLMPHPVRLLGDAANKLEPALRTLSKQSAVEKNSTALRIAGGLGVLLISLGAGAAAWGLSSLPTFGPLFALYLAYTGLALGALLREGRIVLRQLFDKRDLLASRAALGMLVSRETRDLDKQGVMRGLAETVSENANDGFVAPCFYMVLGGIAGGAPEWGLAGLWFFKAVSTLDSMWGYKTKKWRDFGFIAARTDDVLAWIPARITALAMLFTAMAEGRVELRSVLTLWKSIGKDAGTTESPNAGWPMSAAAWLSCAWVGGAAVYFGVRKDKPKLGPEQNEWTQARLQTLFELVRSSCVGSAAVMLALGTLALYWLP